MTPLPGLVPLSRYIIAGTEGTVVCPPSMGTILVEWLQECIVPLFSTIGDNGDNYSPPYIRK